MTKPMDDYNRYIEIATRVLIHIHDREGLQAAIIASRAMIDAASAIARHEHRKEMLRVFPHVPQPPAEDYQFTSFFTCGDGTKITMCRERVASELDLPPAAEAA